MPPDRATLVRRVLALCATLVLGAGEGLSQPASHTLTGAEWLAQGKRLYATGTLRSAREAFLKARALGGAGAELPLWLGSVEERLGNDADARAAYATYLSVSRLRPSLRRSLEARLVRLRQREMAEATARAMRDEAALTPLVGRANVIVVLPFQFRGADSTLRPLERGFADLLSVDLARTGRLTVLEREQLHAITAELAVSASGATDSATAVRAGRLLRAGRFVQGAITQLDGQSLRIDAQVVDAESGAVLARAGGDATMDAIFDLESRIAVGVHDALGVPLTEQERAAMGHRSTTSIAAFLQYGAGLLARDANRLRDAQRYFHDAALIDAHFETAASAAELMDAAITAGASASDAPLELDASGRILPSAADDVANAVNPVSIGDASGENNVALLVLEAGELDDAEDSLLVRSGPSRYVLRRVHESVLPLALSLSPFDGVRFDVSTALAFASFEAPAFRVTTSGLTDTFVRGTWSLAGGRLAFSASAALPTASLRNMDSLAFYIAPQLSSDFLPWASLLRSRSASFTAGAAYALYAAGWSLGLGLATQHAGAYHPSTATGAPSTIVHPGMATRIRFAASHAVGRGEFSGGVTLVEFGASKAGGVSFDAGDRSLVQAAFSQPIGAVNWKVSAWTVDRRDHALLGGGTVPAERVTSVGVSAVVAAAAVTVDPFADVRWWSTAGAQLGSVFQAGARVRVNLGVLEIAPAAQMMWGTLAPKWGPRMPLDGWRLSLAVLVPEAWTWGSAPEP
ncbi:MAG: hypothetical protein NTZ43_15505 [Gemmatimonadetes bacterium]|nr:hypothetical protein [Gemmatimonadota bacterium]